MKRRASSKAAAEARRAAKKNRRIKPKRRKAAASSGRRRSLDNKPNHTIENYRRELKEALEQQAAASEVLKVISGSPGNLEPVFETILTNATRLCEAKFGNLFLYEEGAFRLVCTKNAPRPLPSSCAMGRRLWSTTNHVCRWLVSPEPNV